MSKREIIKKISARDIRFPTTLQGDGSDAMNVPDYSCAYVTVETDKGTKGYGLTFTCGQGTDIVCHAIRVYSRVIEGTSLSDIFGDFGVFYRKIAQHGQLRWLGPEKGVTHLATAAIFNALWDLWARMEGKPLWKLLSDMNVPDYSCAYVTVETDKGTKGYGLTFTCGQGTDIVCHAIRVYSRVIEGTSLSDIFGDFGVFYRKIAQHGQLRWLGPEKGVTHLATAAIFNALWDLWARMEGKPLWKLLSDMSPQEIVSLVDFSYINDVISKEEAIKLLTANKEGRESRVAHLVEKGYPAYTTSCGWLGYEDDKIRRLCKEALTQGFEAFKMKVGGNIEDDIRRIQIIREMIGPDRHLMTDANQKWDVNESIDWMKKLAPYKPYWIEEPTNPDDILGHASIAKALNPLGIGVATGEQCQNRVMFKQFLQAGGLQFCQIDSCRLGSLNEIIAVLLMAAKFNIPVCPHGGGVGLCEYIQHIAMFDYIAVSGTVENRVVEYVDHLHEHFRTPVLMKNGHYQVPQAPGYSIEMKSESLDAYEYPQGSEWQKLFKDGVYVEEK